MFNSILQFCQSGVPELEQVQDKFFEDPSRIAEFVKDGFTPFVQAALNYFGETFTQIDTQLRNNALRREEWHIVRTDDGSILCSIGRIHYRKTLFINKKTGERAYLTDRILGLEAHARMTEDALAAMLEEAADSCYRKGGLRTSLTEDVSKQAVMKHIHDLRFPPEKKHCDRKKKVAYLYIDADEDHVALQYDVRKGDLGKRHHKTVMPLLAYVYEGVEPEHERSDRNHLVNAHYFSGLYDGGSKELWEDVYRYIENHYDTSAIRKIYIHGDGALWIRTGRNFIPNAEFVLDRFHMHKYIITATSHLKDSADDARSEIYRAIHHRRKCEAQEVFERILAVTEEESKQKAVLTSMDYILGHWPGIMASLKDKEHQTGCSAEGHVSHILSDRMSSRPLGWSRVGVDRMSRLQAYKWNGNSMLDLVRYQKEQEELPVAAGAEDINVQYSVTKILRSERNRFGDIGKYYEAIHASFISYESKKSSSIIWHKFF